MFDFTENIQKRHEAHIGGAIFFFTLSIAMLIDQASFDRISFLYPFAAGLASLLLAPLRPSFGIREQVLIRDSKGNTEAYKVVSISYCDYYLKNSSDNVIEKSIDKIEILRLLGRATNKMGK